MCGADRPHLHHIDENHDNNAPENLIPLCPNHHLIDQHDATNKLPGPLLAFFRVHKHRRILAPQFRSVFSRMAFLEEQVEPTPEAIKLLRRQVEELVEFVRHMEHGEFFSKRLAALLKYPGGPYAVVIGDPESERRFDSTIAENRRTFLAQVAANRDQVVRLVVEALDWQQWPDPYRADRNSGTPTHGG